ncbi:MAG: D-alanine--D-alanine ligase family protein [Anaerolineales bacterium]|nr:D-alanine--D-alanine ligase family protein [Anaerolineales bacterium]
MTETQARRVTVAVLFGGRSGEHEVSLMSARSALSVLDPSRYQIIQVGISHQGAWLGGENVLEAFESGETGDLYPVLVSVDPTRPGLFSVVAEKLEKLAEVDVYFPILHGTYGEDGTLQGLFELADVAYVGAGVLGSAVGMDKALFKDVMRANAIPVAESITILRAEIEKNIEEVVRRAEALSAYPLFVKPANLGSSVGITKCRSRSDLIEGLIEAAQYDRRILVERGVRNPREIEVAVLGNDTPQVSMAGEIVPGADFYSYEAKYVLDSSTLNFPAALSPQQTETIRQMAGQAYTACDCYGMARADFLIEPETGAIILNEINTIPGFTKISMYPKLWQACGLSYQGLVDRLIELAFERKADRDRTVREFRRQA